MRVSSIFLMSLLFLNVSFASAAPTKGYEKDAQGKTLVYRAQPSWWLIPSGALLTVLGGFVTKEAYNEVNSRINLNGSFKLDELLPDWFTRLVHLRSNIPLPHIQGNPARAIKCALGTGITLSGVAILYSWTNNYFKLSTPLIIIDQDGLRYEGRDLIRWKDVRSVQVVHDMTIQWNKGKLKKEYALEIVNAYDRLLIPESDIAITVDMLHDLVKQYHKKWY